MEKDAPIDNQERETLTKEVEQIIDSIYSDVENAIPRKSENLASAFNTFKVEAREKIKNMTDRKKFNEFKSKIDKTLKDYISNESMQNTYLKLNEKAKRAIIGDVEKKINFIEENCKSNESIFIRVIQEMRLPLEPDEEKTIEKQEALKTISERCLFQKNIESIKDQIMKEIERYAESVKKFNEFKKKYNIKMDDMKNLFETEKWSDKLKTDYHNKIFHQVSENFWSVVHKLHGERTDNEKIIDLRIQSLIKLYNTGTSVDIQNAILSEHMEREKAIRETTFFADKKCVLCQKTAIGACGSCRIRYYCSQACATADWVREGHHTTCPGGYKYKIVSQ